MAYTYSDLTELTYKPGEVAKFLNCSLGSIQKRDKKGSIKMHRTNTNRRFMYRNDLIELLRANNMWYETEDSFSDDIITLPRFDKSKIKTVDDLIELFDEKTVDKFFIERFRQLANKVKEDV